MIKKRNGVIVAAFSTVTALLSILYSTSCQKTKPDNPYKCNYVYCQNGGKCDSAKCKCPVGYEGSDCGTATKTKFLGVWSFRAYVQGSDSAKLVGTETVYDVDLRESGSNTTFMMHNFDNNQYYNNIICRIDSMDNAIFGFDTTNPLNMYYDHFRIRTGSWCRIQSAGQMVGRIIVQRVNATSNWQHDTLLITAYKKK